ncbi:transposase [Synechococcus sp. J7-Johnson]|uniref:transposase n=1 Tax=Synechococcus sp. J7-Johnson TaxID=2823737 RepID=UPI0037D9BB5A|nr:transposase [Synechococcus sp. J7-Johnson]
MPPLVLCDGEVQKLQGSASSHTLPHSIVQRAQIVLACGAKERGLDGNRLVISDAHLGLTAAIKHMFQGSSWRGARCTSCATS